MTYGGESPSDGGKIRNPVSDPAFLRSPQGFYPRLRAAGAVNMGARGVLVARWADVATVLSDPETFSAGMETVQLGTLRPLIPLQIDPPRHRSYRRILDPLFAPARMKEMEQPVTELARRLLDEIVGQDEVEFVEGFSVPFPSHVFLALLGLPLAELPRFLRMKDGFIRPDTITGKPRGHEDTQALMKLTATSVYQYFEEVIADRRARPGDDLVSWFLQAEVEGDRLTQEDIVDICFLFLVAGLDTVSASLDCMMLYLATHPDRRQALSADPSLIPNAVEELLRWESPVITVARFATKDTEISGCPVQRGQVVTALIGAANTDADEMDDPEVVRWDRDVNRHIAFGRGIHRCLGSNLARLELRIALTEWHARIPDYRVPDDFTADFLSSIRSLKSLPLRLGQAY